MKISDGWKIREFEPGSLSPLEIARPDYLDYFWLETAVPVDVHTVLIRNGIIDHPFYGHNDVKCRWVEEKEWWFRKTFDWYGSYEDDEKVQLVFHGLDTFATVYLNGVELGSTENMFISHAFDVTRELKKGQNNLAVKFDPVSLHVKDKIQYHWSGFSKERIWTRKMQSQFGWDWGPRLVTAGIWKDVELSVIPKTAIKDVYAFTEELTDGKAVLRVETAFTKRSPDADFSVEVTLASPKHQFRETKPVKGKTCLIDLIVEQPDWWWTHDLGHPHLYQLNVKLFKNSEVIDQYDTAIGLRTLEVKTETEEGRGDFAFVLNGVEIFAKGANWIPIDSFVAGVEDERYSEQIELAVNANMNMLRVWGGGIYERDVFYDQCNKQGVLVWQDFMFACALYPDYNRNFMMNVEAEAAHVIRQLRNHPCVALWCGNNENDWLYEALYSSGEIKDPFYGRKIYHDLIPDLLERLDPHRFYWPSSPFGGNDHNSRTVGDTHNWQVWHGNIEPRLFGEPQRVDYSIEGLSFKNFKKDQTLFCSEFGMHAASNALTLKSNMPDEQYYWGSPEMDYRNKDIHHQKGILLMEGYTGIPKDMDEYLSFSMLTQAEGLKYGVEHYRRNSMTKGALIWQFNDCWPGTSWSLIDYYRLPKASYYYAKRFFDPVLFSMDYDEEEGTLRLYLTKDSPEPFQDELTMKLVDFDGGVLFEKSWRADEAPHTSRPVETFNVHQILGECDQRQVYVILNAGADRRNIYYLADQKDLKLKEADLSVALNLSLQTVTLQSNVLTRMVTLEPDKQGMLFSDNFTDLEPGIAYTIQLEKGEMSEAEWRRLSIKTMNPALCIKYLENRS